MKQLYNHIYCLTDYKDFLNNKNHRLILDIGKLNKIDRKNFEREQESISYDEYDMVVARPFKLLDWWRE